MFTTQQTRLYVQYVINADCTDCKAMNNQLPMCPIKTVIMLRSQNSKYIPVAQ